MVNRSSLAVLSLVTGLAGMPLLAATFTVNSPSDVNDADAGDGICETAPGNGVCTLRAAIQEDADLIGLSVLSGAHMTLFRKLIDLLAERDASDIVVFGGGIVPDEDIPVLEEMGVAKIFTPGAPTTEITDWVSAHFDEADSAPS